MMDNVSNSNSSPNLDGVGDLAAAPSPAAGFGLEEQSSTIPSMPLPTMATSEPVSMVAVEEPSVFKEEPSPPSPPASTPAAAPSPDQQVFRRSNI